MSLQDLCVVPSRSLLSNVLAPQGNRVQSCTMLLLQRRESLGLPPGDADPFFELSNGALWQVCSSRFLCVALTLLLGFRKQGCAVRYGSAVNIQMQSTES